MADAVVVAKARLVKDVVCRMTIDADTTPHHAEYQGKSVLFLLRQLPDEIHR
jgi:hypothetical protein